MIRSTTEGRNLPVTETATSKLSVIDAGGAGKEEASAQLLSENHGEGEEQCERDQQVVDKLEKKTRSNFVGARPIT